ncbi:MAG: V-type ATP synthase subunit D [Planctomycetes bacterium]|nr:V-type ATP synthase subunit D [Planctomycetota bacterium]
MASKIKLTRPELKRQRDALARFERYLPMLKLKQQQLQGAVLKADQVYRESLRKVGAAEAAVNEYRAVLADMAGINVEALSAPTRIVSHDVNVAGVTMPVLDDVQFGPLNYSLFATPPWVDRAIADLRQVSRLKAESEILGRQLDRLRRELTRIVQRVNLFDKVMIPEAKETIRIIRIKLGDEQTAAVGRAKIAKGKLNEAEVASGQPAYEEGAQ